MNDARRRRLVIKKRAEKSRELRCKKDIKKLCQHGGVFNGGFCKTCHPIEPLKPPTYRAWVYLKDAHDHRHVVVDIPVNKATKTVYDMHMNGFWGKILEGEEDYVDSAVFWVAPHEIRRIIFWTEDTKSRHVRPKHEDLCDFEDLHDL
jgi:hypothetical protein